MTNTVVYTRDGTPVAAEPLTDSNGKPVAVNSNEIPAPNGFDSTIFAQDVGGNPFNYLNFKTSGQYDLQRTDMGVPYGQNFGSNPGGSFCI